MTFAGKDTSGSADELIWFREWQEGLERSSLPDALNQVKRRDIFGLLRACKQVKRPVSVGLIRWWLERVGRSAGERAEERESFTWFYREAKRGNGVKSAAKPFDAPVSAPDAVVPPPAGSYQSRSNLAPPPAGRDDLGATDWEQALIKASRRRGLLWRTEHPYRGWRLRKGRLRKGQSILFAI